MGHLNVGFYVAKCMEALVGLAAELGMPHAFSPYADATLIVREQHIRFLREAHAGARLSIDGGVLEMGEDEARLLLLMRHDTGELAASFHLLVAHATPRDARAFPWPTRVRERARGLRIETPEKARPRSVLLGPIESRASLPRARDLGLKRIAMGAIRPADCDAFGRMRTETLMARLSDGIVHLFDGTPPGTAPEGRRLGGVALEYRMIYLEWPRLGDRFELRSGTKGGDSRVRRLVHWFLDPTTGKAWGAAEAVAASFDLDARKIVTLSDEEVAAWQERAIPDLLI
jgi:acyl-CoA thioester hydrolase